MPLCTCDAREVNTDGDFPVSRYFPLREEKMSNVWLHV